MAGMRGFLLQDHLYILENRLYGQYNSYFDSEILTPRKLSYTGNISGDKPPVSREKL
jgi:hypothetical protein